MERQLRKTLPGGKFKGVSTVRSRTMGAIRGKHTKTTEQALRMALIRAGVTGWELHVQALPGNPDFYFPNEGIAVFVDGCFWHGCAKCGHIPKTRSEFWTVKFLRNQRRDRKNTRKLRKQGIKVVRIWEHSLSTSAGTSRTVLKLKLFLLRSGKTANIGHAS